MCDRICYIASSLLASLSSGSSAAGRQAIGLLGQTLGQRAVAAGYGEVLLALGAALFAGLASRLLFKYGIRRGSQGVFPMRRNSRRSAGSQAVPLTATIPWRSPLSDFATVLQLAGRQWPLRFAVALSIGLAASSALAAPEGSPLGTWSTANGHGVVAIEQCGDALCGRIVGIERKPTEPMPTDVDGRPQCGLTIITNERPRPNGTWVGHITDPRDGGVYQAELWLDEQGNLRLRGFIGIPALGATQTWHRFSGHLTAACGLA